MPPKGHSAQYRRTPDGGRRQVSVKEALAVLADASKDAKTQAMVKHIEEALEGSDSGQTDKATEHDSPGARSARAAGGPTSTDARDAVQP